MSAAELSTDDTTRTASANHVDHAATSAEEATNQYLTFFLADEEYGVNILRVQEIKGWSSVTKVPNTDHHVLGVINLRGTVVPIIDLRQRFGLESVEFGPLTVVIVLKIQGSREQTVGIVVDAVSDVYHVTAESINPPPESCGGIDSNFVAGLVTMDEKMVILLDLDELMGRSDVE